MSGGLSRDSNRAAASAREGGATSSSLSLSNTVIACPKISSNDDSVKVGSKNGDDESSLLQHCLLEVLVDIME